MAQDMKITDLVALDLLELDGICDADKLCDLTELFYENAGNAANELRLPCRIEAHLRPDLPEEPGAAGYACDNEIHVRVEDVDQLLFGTHSGVLQAEFAATIAHELHHCKRNTKCAPARTLAERLVSEGLAMRFEAEACGRGALLSFNDPHIQQLRNRALPLLNEPPDGENRYRFGTRTKAPVLQGDIYGLGEVLMSDYLSAAQLTASQGATIPAKMVMEWWEARRYELSSDLPVPENHRPPLTAPVAQVAARSRR